MLKNERPCLHMQTRKPGEMLIWVKPQSARALTSTRKKKGYSRNLVAVNSYYTAHGVGKQPGFSLSKRIWCHYTMQKGILVKGCVWIEAPTSFQVMKLLMCLVLLHLHRRNHSNIEKYHRKQKKEQCNRPSLCLVNTCWHFHLLLVDIGCMQCRK